MITPSSPIAATGDTTDTACDAITNSDEDCPRKGVDVPLSTQLRQASGIQQQIRGGTVSDGATPDGLGADDAGALPLELPLTARGASPVVLVDDGRRVAV